MSPDQEQEILEIALPDRGFQEPCNNCEYWLDIIHAKSQLEQIRSQMKVNERQSESYGILTVFCGICLCLMVMSFFTFLMLAAWFERKPSVDTLIVTTVFGLFSAMIGVLFGISQKKHIEKSIEALKKQD